MRLTRSGTAAVALIAIALVVSCLIALPGCLSPAAVEAQDSFLVTKFVGNDGREIAAITVSGKPSGLSSEAVDTPEPEIQMGVNVLPDVPAFDWSYGCSATSAAMLFGYYDRIGYGNVYTGATNGGVCPLDNSMWGDTRYPHITCHECPLSATCLGTDNRTSEGHVNDYWIDYNSASDDPYITGGWLEHTQGDCTGDFMGTNQSRFGNRDGATTFYYYTSGDPLYDYEPTDPNRRDGCHGMRLFAESRGYAVVVNFSQYIRGEGTNPSKGFTFDDFVEEIDVGRPVLVQLEGHTVLGFGYNTSGSQVYIHDTWDHSAHQMTWGGNYAGMEHYGVSVVQLTELTSPLVVTDDASNVTDASVTLNGELNYLGMATSVDVSFEWSTNSGTYTDNTTPQSMSTTGPFAVDLSNLSPGTDYYYRAKAVGSETNYGDERSFTTSTTPPLVVTRSATNVAANFARLNGSLASLGSASSDNVSFEWGSSPGSYLCETASRIMTAVGSFTFDLTGLSPGTAYYYRAKAVGHGTSYGDEESWITLTTPPSVVTVTASGITATTARLNGNLVDLGTAPSVSVAFQWGMTSGQYSSEKTLVSVTATGSFSLNLGSLMPGTKYYYRARAVGDGTGYGSEESFTTLAIPPSVSTLDVTGIGTSSARLDGRLDSLGSATAVSVSFLWGTSPGTYLSEHAVQSMTSVGAFGAELPGLAPGTTYYFRAKAVGEGMSYGAEKSFTTSTIPPLVTTNAATAVGTDSVLLHGNLSGLGTADAVQVSCQWGTEPGSYSGETAPQSMTAKGEFDCDLAGLDPGTIYYFRAKAVGDGTSYGSEENFTALVLPPSVTTGSATNLTPDSATLNADLISLGTATSVSISFQWGTHPGSYDSQTAPLTAPAPGAMSFDLTGLVPATTYYFRAVAQGSHGTAYGPEETFAALVIPPSIAIEDAAGITEERATLSVNLVNLGTAESVDVSFLWGTIPGGPYGNETISQTVTSGGLVTLEVTGLMPGTAYYYIAAASGDDVSFSAEESFSTLTPADPANGESIANADGEAEADSSAGSSAAYVIWEAMAIVLGLAALVLIMAGRR